MQSVEIKKGNKQSAVPEIMAFSENDKSSVYSVISAYARQEDNLSQVEIRNVCRCENCKQQKSKCRAYLVISSWEDFKQQTDESNMQYIEYGECIPGSGKTVFLFPGNGIHQKNMLNILKKSDSFLEERLEQYTVISDLLYHIGLLDETKEDNIINQIRVFISELVLAQFWTHMGCEPDYLIGHSLGEYAAACFAGVFSVGDCIKMLIARGRILEKSSGSYSMAAIYASGDEVQKLILENHLKLEIVAFNASDLVTVSGDRNDITNIVECMKNNGILVNIINSKGGGHNSSLSDYAEEFRCEIADLEFHIPMRTIISTVHMGISSELIATPEYWIDHLTHSVCFSQAIDSLKQHNVKRMIDMGVSPVLLSMAMRNIHNPDISWIPSIRSGRNYRSKLFSALGMAFLSGVDIKWSQLYGKNDDE